MKLTEKQQTIVEIEKHTDNRKIACLASAGSGKSTVIENRVAHLVKKEKIKPSRIALFSFSRAATKEIRDRLKDKLGYGKFSELTVSTLHAFCYHVIQDHWNPKKKTDINVISANQLAKAVASMISNADEDDDYLECEAGVYIEELGSALKGNRKPEFSPEYKALDSVVRDWMKENDLYLFDDLLFMTYELFMKRPDLKEEYRDKFDYWFIDEAQDTTKIMIDIIEILLREDTYLLLSFDIVQSLYQFAGADPFNLMNFVDRVGAEIRQLDETFRFGPTIAELADMIVTNIDLDERYKMFTSTQQRSNAPQYIPSGHHSMNRIDIAEDIAKKINEGVPLQDISVLSRTNKPLVEYQKELAKHGIPSKMKFGYIWNRKEIKLLLTIIRLMRRNNSEDLLYLLKTLPGKYNLDQKRLKMMRSHYKSDDVVEFLTYFIENKVKGLGVAITGGVRKLVNLFINIRSMIEAGNNDPNLPVFREIANIIDMGSCEFMLDSTNSEGQSNADERWEFVSILDQFRQDHTLGVSDVESALKIQFTTESEKDTEAVQLKTIHSSKGETLPHIYLLGDTFDERFMADSDSIRSELFVLYVAVTRTKTELQIWGELPRQFSFLEETDIEIMATEEELEERSQREPQEALPLIQSLKKRKEIVNNYRPKDLRPFAAVEAHAETPNAILMTLKHPTKGEVKEWIPKSQLAFDVDVDAFLLPRWLQKKKGLAA